MKELIKKHNKKVLLIVGLLIGGVIGVSAGEIATIFDSKEVSYSNKDMKAKNVQDAIDELYRKASGQITIDDLKDNVVTSGDGLYDNGDGSYTYKGESPKNYITFNNEDWRIMSILKDGTIKIIKDEILTSLRFDDLNNRNSSSYCTYASSYGCSAWATTTNIIGTPPTFTNGSFSGTVTKDATLNTYLNEDYYKNTLKNNSNIVKGTFNIGPAGNETAYQWNGHVGLATESEYKNAALDSSDTNYIYRYNNYLKKTYYWWLLSPDSYYTFYVYIVSDTGHTSGSYAHTIYGVRPVLHLSSNITLTGTGEQGDNAYKIS